MPLVEGFTRVGDSRRAMLLVIGAVITGLLGFAITRAIIGGDEVPAAGVRSKPDAPGVRPDAPSGPKPNPDGVLLGVGGEDRLGVGGEDRLGVGGESWLGVGGDGVGARSGSDRGRGWLGRWLGDPCQRLGVGIERSLELGCG
jgi:hypothetical protein